MSETRPPKPVVRVSRNGLTRCKRCQAFFKATPESINAQTRCIFCGETLGASLKEPPPTALTALLRRGRGSVVAASLFGVTALTPACLDPTVGTVGGVADAVTDTVSGADGGADAATPPDILVTQDVAPRDVGGPDADPLDVADANAMPDNLAMPAYGFPPPPVIEPDAGADAADASDARDTEVEVEVIEPAPPQDDYGLPPDWE